MFIVYCILYIVYCILFIVYCILYIVYCILYIVHCILYIVHCILYIVHCSLFIVYCILHLSSSQLGFLGRDIDPYRIPEPSASRINARWTNDEHLLAVQGKIWGTNLGTIGGDEYRVTKR